MTRSARPVVPPVASRDQAYAGIRRNRLADAASPGLPVPPLDREQRIAGGRVGRPGVHLCEVDRDAPGFGPAERRDLVLGPLARLVLGTEFRLGTPVRPAQQDRLPRLGDCRRDPPVARLGRAVTRRR